MNFIAYLLAHVCRSHLHKAVQKMHFFLQEQALVLHPFLQVQPREDEEAFFLLRLVSSSPSSSESTLSLFLLLSPVAMLLRS